jgi:hypothetical protein
LLLRLLMPLMLPGLLIANSAPAHAQPVKPNILIIFDTSGSMVRNGSGTWTSCDGQYPPVGNSSMGTDSRIYNLKDAVRQALYEIGVDEANFGLARFAQTEQPNDLDSCAFPSGEAGYYTFPGSGCSISTHSTQTTYGSWFDSAASQAIVVPVTDPAQGLDPPNSSAFDPTDANLPEIFRWLDHYTTSSGGSINNPEIQAIPAQSTPIGRSLFYARMYFDNYVIPNDDPNVLPCRSNIVIIATDGGEACDGSMTSMPSEPNDPSDCVGGSEFNPRRQACLMYRPWVSNSWESIRTYVLTMPGLESDNDPIALAGGTSQALTADFTDPSAVKSALLSIIADAVPSGEVCNGLDDNCNGQIDEGVKNQCGSYPQWCATESCNNQDDDCDGQVDEGLPPNACGGPCGAPVPAEIPCNGIDDDCNPATPDEPAGCTCGVEYCNGVDDDCDGLVDDDDPDMPTTAVPCGPNPPLGLCEQGTLICNYGNSICDGAVYPEAETCDGQDENCNGIVDDVVYDPPECVIPNCQTACCDGHWECQNGQDVCVPNAITANEDCNGADDDCDGRIDEGAQCEQPLVCWYGDCAFRVPPDGCGTGLVEREGLCVTDPCRGTQCEGGLICEPVSGDCIDPCAGFNCSDPAELCDVTQVTCDASGTCTADDTACVIPDCYLDPALCVDGEVCVDGSCAPDPCFGQSAIDCGTDACRDATCIATCVGVECDVGQQCTDGVCVAEPCGTFSCPPGQTCVDGQCAQDPCGGVTCKAGQVCEDGHCTDDPCRLIACPAGTVCREGQCVGTDPDGGVIQPDAGPGADAGPPTDAGDATGVDSGLPEDFNITAGGGGCACHSATGSGAGGAGLPGGAVLSLLLLTLLAFRRRRQRRHSHLRNRDRNR